MAPARVTIVLGKGGVGRTTVAAALALDWARQGQRVLLTSVASPAELSRRLAHEGGAAGPAAPAGDRLALVELDPRALVDDLVRRMMPFGPMADAIVRHPGYESMVAIVPGIREMAVLHHVWEARNQGWDRIVLDGPATGHGLHFLEAPRRSEHLLVGRLRARAHEVRDFLQDPAAADLVLVTLPEETPVRETSELAASLRADGFAVDNVVVNKWFPSVFEDPASRAVLDALAQDGEARAGLQRAIARHSRIDVEAWLEAAGLVRGMRDEHEQHLQELSGIGAKLALVPFLAGAEGRLLRVAQALREGVA